MTAKILPDAKDTLRPLTDYLSYLQVRTEAISKVLTRTAKKTSQPERAAIEVTAQVLSKLSQRLSSLHTTVQRRPSSAGSRPRLSSEASVYLLSIFEQSDAVLDVINTTRSAASIERCTTSLLVVSSTTAIASQCLKHAQLVDDFPDVTSREEQDMRVASRARLERYVTDQQVQIVQWLTNDLQAPPDRRASHSRPRKPLHNLEMQTLLALLHPSLVRSNQWMYAKISRAEIEDLVEAFSQKILMRWITNTDLGSTRPVVHTQTHAVQPTEPVRAPQRSRSSMPETRPIRMATPQLSKVNTTIPIQEQKTEQKTRRHSTTASSPRTTSAAFPVFQGTPPSRFQPSSFPSGSLRDPPFVVTHARAQAQARHYSPSQPVPQPHARRASTPASSAPSASQTLTQHNLSRTRSDHSHHQHQHNEPKPPGSPVSDTSSLAPTPDVSEIVVTWRLSALGQHWDFENEALVHNTGSLPPSAARHDRYAETQIRKSLLVRDAVDAFCGTGAAGGSGGKQVVKWDVIERKVVNADKSQRKRFVAIRRAMSWDEVELLVRRSGEMA